MTPPTPTAPYREAGAERRAFVCPSCSGQVFAETEESAICSRCDTRFSTREATSAIEQAAIQRFAQSLAPPPVQRGLTQAGRWGVTTVIMGCLVVAGLLAGAVGVAIGGVAIAHGNTRSTPVIAEWWRRGKREKARAQLLRTS